jgi:hypothetical protein
MSAENVLEILEHMTTGDGRWFEFASTYRGRDGFHWNFEKEPGRGDIVTITDTEIRTFIERYRRMEREIEAWQNVTVKSYESSKEGLLSKLRDVLQWAPYPGSLSLSEESVINVCKQLVQERRAYNKISVLCNEIVKERREFDKKVISTPADWGETSIPKGL